MEDTEGFTQMALGAAGAERAFQNTEQPKHGLFARFYMHPVQNAAKTLAQGRPIFDETEYVAIMVPGDKASIVERPVRLGIQPGADNVKFSVEYNLFKQQKNQQVSGTPLKEFPPISRSQVRELEHFHVRTVEQLAELSDTHAQKFMGLNSLRELARRFIQHAEGAAPLSALQGQLEDSLNAQQTMYAQMQDMAKELGALKSQLAGEPVAAVEVTLPPAATAQKPAAEKAPVEEETNADTAYASAPLDLGSDEIDEPDTEVTDVKAPKKQPRRSIAK